MGGLAIATAAEAFHPGQVWLDDRGVPINAHGGGVLFHGGVYYWFGEHKIEGEAGNKAEVGVHCYSSRDLYNWKDEGIALAVSDDPASDIAKGCILERPKVIYNQKTGKFVMYFHLELKGQEYRAARAGIAVADKPAGPYSFVRSLRPNAGQWPINVTPEQQSPESVAEAIAAGAGGDGVPGDKVRKYNILGVHFAGGQMARDMTLFVDDDGKAYHIFSSEHNGTTHISELSDDYLSYSGKYVRVFEHRWMEAPAICKRAGKYYFIASDCSGWNPNAARSAVADSIWGPWTELGNPCEGTNFDNGLGPEKTFGGQSTFLLPVQGKKDAYIAMFDLWQPKNAIDGRYAWLPVTFTEKGFKITWQKEWDHRGCGGQSDAGVTGTPPAAKAGNFIPADNPRIWKGGRWLSGEGSESTSWGGSYARVRFTGTRFALSLGAPCRLDLTVDGKSAPRIDAGPGVVEAASNLKPGEHEVCLALPKYDSENKPDPENKLALKGIILDEGAKLLPPQPRPKLIEFIGDSITSGTFGNYAWLTAEQLGAEHSQVAIGGIGLLDGRPNFVSPTTGMAWQYFKATSDLSRRDVPDWDFSHDKPNLVVINLGTNDSGRSKDEEISSGLADFIRKVRAKRPGIPIVVLEPFGIFRKSGETEVWTRFLEKGVADAVEKVRREGDADVHVCSTKGWLTNDYARSLVADHVHPNSSGHGFISGKLAEALKAYCSAQYSKR